MVVGVGVGSAVPAAAHGEPEFSAEVGPFAVETFDEQISETDLLYTVVVTDPTTGLAVRGATVEVSATSPTRRVGPLVGNELGGAYQVLLADTGDEPLQIAVRIATGDETVTFSHELTPTVVEGGRSWRNTTTIALAAVIAVVAAVGLGRAAHRRARHPRPQRS